VILYLARERRFQRVARIISSCKQLCFTSSPPLCLPPCPCATFCAGSTSVSFLSRWYNEQILKTINLFISPRGRSSPPPLSLSLSLSPSLSLSLSLSLSPSSLFSLSALLRCFAALNEIHTSAQRLGFVAPNNNPSLLTSKGLFTQMKVFRLGITANYSAFNRALSFMHLFSAPIRCVLIRHAFDCVHETSDISKHAYTRAPNYRRYKFNAPTARYFLLEETSGK